MVHFPKCSTVAANCSTETQVEMRDGTVEHFPGEVAADFPAIHGGQQRQERHDEQLHVVGAREARLHLRRNWDPRSALRNSKETP